MKLYRQLIDYMAKTHGTVLTEHVGEASLQSMGEMDTTDGFIYKRDMAWLRSADAVVAEVTRASLGVGYEIAYAEQLGIPVLCLYRPKANKGSRLSAMISGSDKVVNRNYKQRSDAVGIIDTFFKDTAPINFPTIAAFLIPVEIKAMPELQDQHGVFATQPIKKGTPIWEWTERVQRIHYMQLEEAISKNIAADPSFDVKLFLRQGFVLPNNSDSNDNENFFNSNPTDAGRFTNHACNPSCSSSGTKWDIAVGEEITLDYRNHGNPEWYQKICAKYGIETETELGNRICKEQGSGNEL